jgi:prephenate dehydrogenase
MALIGVGYIGGSWALAARERGVVGDCVGYDSDATATAAAVERGVVARAAASVADAVTGADLVMLAAPVGALAAALDATAVAVSPAAVVIDVGSVKAPIMAAATARGLRFVGCHPMAGTEARGVAAADAGLFVDRVCFICAAAGMEAAIVDRVAAAWERVGARAAAIDPAVHDAVLAAVSHLPHVASFALAGTLAGDAEALCQALPSGPANTSLRDTTRIAASSPAVWRDIFLENRASLLPLVERLESWVATMKEAMKDGDAAALEALLAEANRGRRRLVGP